MWTRRLRYRHSRRLAACVAAIALCTPVGCPDGGGGGGPGELDAELTPAFASLDFVAPVKLVQHPTDEQRWYVVEQAGVIWTFLESDPAGTVSAAVDVGASVNLSPDDEQGLLGLAFDPDFDATGGEVYLAYTDEGTQDSILARYLSVDGVGFAPAVDPIVLAIPHPLNNHNAGDLHFGPDGFLYYSMGDGGGSGDPSRNAQNRSTLLGSVLRLDVRSPPPLGEDYAIPPGNPGAGNPHCDTGVSPTGEMCPEIYAFGLRNPWRMGFDPDTGELWLGDVGQGSWEEVDRILVGRNYGWDCFEGDAPFQNVPACALETFEPPEAVYPNPPGPAAVTGGVVYRNTEIPGLAGHYLYADYYSGEIWALDTATDDPPQRLLDTSLRIAAFGQARGGAIYVVVQDFPPSPPSIWRFVPAAP